MKSNQNRQTWNKGKLIGQKPPLKPKGHLGYPNSASERAAGPKLGNVQHHYRQQAARLRSGQFARERHHP